MMKRLLISILLLISFSAIAQEPTQGNFPGAYRYKNRLYVDSLLLLPSHNSITPIPLRDGAVRYNPIIGFAQLWKSGTWGNIGSPSSLQDVTTIGDTTNNVISYTGFNNFQNVTGLTIGRGIVYSGNIFGGTFEDLQMQAGNFSVLGHGAIQLNATANIAISSGGGGTTTIAGDHLFFNTGGSGAITADFNSRVSGNNSIFSNEFLTRGQGDSTAAALSDTIGSRPDSNTTRYVKNQYTALQGTAKYWVEEGRINSMLTAGGMIRSEGTTNYSAERINFAGEFYFDPGLHRVVMQSKKFSTSEYQGLQLYGGGSGAIGTVNLYNLFDINYDSARLARNDATKTKLSIDGAIRADTVNVMDVTMRANPTEMPLSIQRMITNLSGTDSLYVIAGTCRPIISVSDTVNTIIRWEFLTAAGATGHDIIHLDSVVAQSNGQVRIYFPTVYNVVSFIAAPDDALCGSGVVCGSSVGASTANIQVSYVAGTFMGSMVGNGAAWTGRSTGLSTWGLSGGQTFTLTLPTGSTTGFNNSDYSDIVAKYAGSNNYQVRRTALVANTSVTFAVTDIFGNTVTDALTASDIMQIISSKQRMISLNCWKLDALKSQASVLLPNSNIWILAVMKK